MMIRSRTRRRGNELLFGRWTDNRIVCSKADPVPSKPRNTTGPRSEPHDMSYMRRTPLTSTALQLHRPLVRNSARHCATGSLSFRSYEAANSPVRIVTGDPVLAAKPSPSAPGLRSCDGARWLALYTSLSGSIVACFRVPSPRMQLEVSGP